MPFFMNMSGSYCGEMFKNNHVDTMSFGHKNVFLVS